MDSLALMSTNGQTMPMTGIRVLLRGWPFFAVALAILLWSMIAAAADPPNEATENEIKAAMVFKFLSYTSWPAPAFESESSPYQIWVLGAGGVAEELQEIAAARQAGDRPLRVMRASSPTQITGPHVVYVGRGSDHHLPEVRQLVDQHPLLIITENPRGLGRGSIINLRIVEGRMGFDVSLSRAREASLDISSRLLSVANSVDQ